MTQIQSYKGSRRKPGRKIRDDREKIEHKARMQRALELRMAGASYAQIVKANIGYTSLSQVSYDVNKILNTVKLETPEDLIMLDLARLDDLQQVLTLHFHKGNVTLSGSIMQVMKFRHELLGIDQESIRQRNMERTQVTNNGIMVVQGSTRDYLAAMMEASGLDERERERELQRLEAQERKELPPATSGNSGSDSGKVIQGELIESPIPSGTPSSNPSQKSSHTGQTKPVKKVRLRVVKRKDAETGAPGSQPEAQTATQKPAHRKGGTLSPRDTDKPLEARLEAFAVAQEREQTEQEKALLPKARLAEPVVQVDLDSPALRERVRQRVLEREVKTPDNNHPVSPGVPYKAAPRKLTPQEGRQVVLRKLKKPGSTAGRLVDRVPVETSREEIP